VLAGTKVSVRPTALQAMHRLVRASKKLAETLFTWQKEAFTHEQFPVI